MIRSQKSAIGFFCEPILGGYSFSLTTLLGHFLQKAEQQYGNRDKEWTILGIEFCGDGPMLWYPGNCRYISIMLAEQASQNTAEAIFELAHEVVHLLAPTGDRSAPVIEEGLATLFAHQNSTIRTDMPSYLRAERLVSTLLSGDPHAILKLRKERPAFVKFTPDFLRERYPLLSDADAADLCAPFER